MSTASNEVTSDQIICCFCKCINKQGNIVAAETLYATKTKAHIDHVKNMTADWTEMAKVLQDENLLIKISHGMLLQTRCIIINAASNVATKNIENDISKNSNKKTMMMKKHP